MASSFRTNLLKHEMARREEVISAAEKLTPGKGDAFRRMYQKGDLQRRCAAKILSEETGKLPLVSADFQHWYEDLHVWKIACKSPLLMSLSSIYTILLCILTFYSQHGRGFPLEAASYVFQYRL